MYWSPLFTENGSTRAAESQFQTIKAVLRHFVWNFFFQKYRHIVIGAYEIIFYDFCDVISLYDLILMLVNQLFSQFILVSSI